PVVNLDKPLSRRRRIGYMAAAAVLLLLASGAYFWFSSQSRSFQKSLASQTRQDILPGRDGAILTLADGSRVVLDSLGNGVVALQNGIRVMLQDGQLTYNFQAAAGEDISGRAADDRTAPGN